MKFYASPYAFYAFPTYDAVTEAVDKAVAALWEQPFVVGLAKGLLSPHKRSEQHNWGISALPVLERNTPVWIVEKRGKIWKVLSGDCLGWILVEDDLWETFDECDTLHQ